jgi:G3E family GTPase
MNPPTQPPIPVTVVAGYLGAGKTTLLNGLLQSNHGMRLAVLVNDFGTVNIDVDTIVEHNGTTMSLVNGCVCCSITDSLGDALDSVRELIPAPDQIVIEASGVADPSNVAAYGEGWPGCRLDSVIVVADAETIMSRALDKFVGELVVRQLTRADIVVLTKCDLISVTQREDVTAWLRESIGEIPVVVHDGRPINAALLLGSNPASPSDSRPAPEADQRRAHRVDMPLFDSIALEIDRSTRREQIEFALRAWPDHVIRVKGLVRIEAENNQVYLIQRVGARWSVKEMMQEVDESHVGQLVVLGIRGTLDADALRRALVVGSVPTPISTSPLVSRSSVTPSGDPSTRST